MATVGERAGLVAAAGQVGTEPDGSRDRGRKRSGMVVPRVFSTEGISPFDQVDWDLRTAEIKDERGRVIFQQVDCEIPRGWSQLATNVVASKYFYGDVASGNGCPGRGEAGVLGSPADRPRDPDDRRLGPGRRLLRHRRGRRAVLRRADGPLPATSTARSTRRSGSTWGCFTATGSPVRPTTGDGTRRPGLWSGPPAPTRPPGVGLLHPERQRRHGRHHAAGPQRGHALQVRLGDRHRPLDPALQPREALRRRQAVRAGQLHAGLRRHRQRRQVGRQDAPGRQDADPQVLAPRHPRVHRVQDQGGEEGPDPDPRRATRPTSTARPTAR